MDALQMIREDHRRVKELFRQFEEAEDKNTKQAAAETALVELNIHAILEEEIFYPAFRRQGNGSGEIVERAEQEHHTAEQLMDELMKMEPGNQEFDAKFHVLIENVKSHIDEEEAEMLPQAAEAGLSRMEQLGERMTERRQQLLKDSGNGRRSTSGTRRKQSSTTRTRSASKTGTRASSTRTRASSGTRSRTTTGRTSRNGAGARAKAASARSSTKASGSRTRTTASSGARASGTKTRTASRTVKQAGGTRTTRTRSNTSGRRSGSQSGR
jgi:hypothetical protein